MQYRKQIVMIAALTSVALTNTLFGHCEIPCGIYDDRARVEMIREHSRTIEKSMNKIRELQEQEDKSYNQLVRWITNKEEHANKIQKIVYQYFMNQRIKVVSQEDNEDYETYVQQITLLHRMLVQAMKCKQTTDTAHIENLRTLVDRFENSYFDEHKH